MDEDRHERTPPSGSGSSHPVEAEITDFLFGVLGLMKRHLVTAVAELGMTPQQARALRCLVPGTATPMGDLAAELHCDASTVTGIVDRLEEQGLVERRPGSGDRRVKTLAVTEKGARIRNEFWDRLLEGAPHLVGLSAAQRLELRDLLRRVVTAAGSMTD